MINLTHPGEAGFSQERLKRIDSTMAGYVSNGDLAGIITMVERKGKTVHLNKCGYRDLAQRKPIEYDTLFRIYSMTKPVTSVALLMLLEQARFQLNDPIHKYLPEFKNVKVMDAQGKLHSPNTDIAIHHLLTHTAGLTYGVFLDTPVDKLYQEANLFEKSKDLDDMVQRIASLPLTCHPGERWVYSVATDVVGRLIEVLSGMSEGH